MEEGHEGALRVTSLDGWPETGLPWAVFWLKELLTWGTLEPVVAFTLSRRLAFSRRAAMVVAESYYRSQHRVADLVDPLDPRIIHDWVSEVGGERPPETQPRRRNSVPVELVRDTRSVPRQIFRVMPIQSESTVRWLDIAGHELAVSPVSDIVGLRA